MAWRRGGELGYDCGGDPSGIAVDVAGADLLVSAEGPPTEGSRTGRPLTIVYHSPGFGVVASGLRPRSGVIARAGLAGSIISFARGEASRNLSHAHP